ncbi:MAG TPA: 2-hydroxychromene-2-carboxylate isomerase [Noviherbaspirillum sp.]|jgi:2-hydroxychromene-2-carboxylate isomerase|uniref:2-hydroxychromene-2-carboxylate isomerase n=1 Tax=Noviherbaspirillum sp. TaxID=1926288 RepID=UPI002F947D15
MTVSTPEPKCIAFWFEFGSTYSYLSAMRIEALAQASGVRVLWKPFLLGPIFKELGWSTSPFVLQEEKGRYMWRDMARRAEKQGLAFRRPSAFPRTALLPLRVALLGTEAPWIGSFCRRVMVQNWVEDREIDTRESVLAALEGLVDNPPALVAMAHTDANKLGLRRQTEEARRLGIFGAPTFFVGSEMYWGDDRLEDALEAAVSRSDAACADGCQAVRREDGAHA